MKRPDPNPFDGNTTWLTDRFVYYAKRIQVIARVNPPYEIISRYVKFTEKKGSYPRRYSIDNLVFEAWCDAPGGLTALFPNATALVNDISCPIAYPYLLELVNKNIRHIHVEMWGSESTPVEFLKSLNHHDLRLITLNISVWSYSNMPMSELINVLQIGQSISQLAPQIAWNLRELELRCVWLPATSFRIFAKAIHLDTLHLIQLRFPQNDGSYNIDDLYECFPSLRRLFLNLDHLDLTKLIRAVTSDQLHEVCVQHPSRNFTEEETVALAKSCIQHRHLHILEINLSLFGVNGESISRLFTEQVLLALLQIPSLERAGIKNFIFLLSTENSTLVPLSPDYAANAELMAINFPLFLHTLSSRKWKQIPIVLNLEASAPPPPGPHPTFPGYRDLVIAGNPGEHAIDWKDALLAMFPDLRLVMHQVPIRDLDQPAFISEMWRHCVGIQFVISPSPNR
jgi:hypothetical protein